MRLLALALLLPVSAAAAPADDPVAPIHAFIDGFNKGDTATAYAAYAPGVVSIIDEFQPHFWVGPKAPQNWAASYDANAKAEGVSDGSVALGTATVTDVEGKAAYVTIPATYSYKSHGKPMHEAANMAYALVHTKDGWKIRAWSWTGTVPVAGKL